MRIGIGYDVHKLVENRKLIIGGVLIPFEKGLLGHSDADVLTHAVTDALLGAICEGDIGKNFPDNDDTYKNISSLILLEKVFEMLKDKNYKVVNLDCIIVAEKPKMLPFINEMQNNFKNILKTDAINIKATTEEGLNFTGKGLGIAAKAICLLEKINNSDCDC